jgi:hypothetical protein
MTIEADAVAAAGSPNNEASGILGQTRRQRLSLFLTVVISVASLLNFIQALSFDKNHRRTLDALVSDGTFPRILRGGIFGSNMSRPEAVLSQAPVSIATINSMKIGLYMTTHQSDEHMEFLRRCWPRATQKLPLLQNSDLLYYTSAATDGDVPHSILSALKFRNITIFRYSEAPVPPGALQRENRARKQLGAKRAMVDPILKHWFDDYDWIIRLNPDVLIRNDTWLIKQILDPSVHAILYGFSHSGVVNSAIHSDFYAFRPNVLMAQSHLTEELLRVHLADNKLTAERQLRVLFDELIENDRYPPNQAHGMKFAGRIAWIPGVERKGRKSRTLGLNSAILHEHDLVRFCPDYFDATDGKWF